MTEAVIVSTARTPMMRMASGVMGRQLLHQAIVFATLIMAGLSYAETASAQNAQEEAMKSSGLSEVASARTKVLSAYSRRAGS